MKLILWTMGGLAVGAIVSSIAWLLPETTPVPLAMNLSAIAPDSVAEPGPPIAQINPQAPIQLRVINESRYRIATALTEPPSATRYLAPGEATIFGRLHTQFLPPPLNLLIFLPDAVNNPDEPIAASTLVSVAGNEIIVVIKPIENPDRAVPSTMMVDETGRIFQY